MSTASTENSTSPRLRPVAPRLSSSKAKAALLLAPILLLLVPGFVAPLILSLSHSVTDPKFGFQNFVDAWESLALRRIMITTLSIAAWTTAVSLIMGFPVAYWLTTLKARRRRVVFLLILTPLLIPILARLYAWTILLGRKGLVNWALEETLGKGARANLIFNDFAVVTGMVHVLLPYMIVVLYTVMLAIPSDSMAAARSLGASPWQAFRRVYFPLVRSGVFSGSLLVFVLSLGFFATPAVLGGGRVATIPTYIEKQIAILALGDAATSSFVLLVAALAIFAVFNKTFGTQRLITGGTKS